MPECDYHSNDIDSTERSLIFSAATSLMSMVAPKHLLSRRWTAQDFYSPMNKGLVKILALFIFALLFYRKISVPTRTYDPYSRPFCDASGNCGENPEISSPRTVFSARSEEQYVLWWKVHAALNRTAAEYATRRQQAAQKSLPPLILLGDSITESWIGTDMGIPIERAKGVSTVLADFFQHDYDPLVLAVGGDQTQHLLYRLQNGQLLPSYANDDLATYVVLIGTNNLGSGELPTPTSIGVMTVAEYILKSTKGRLVLVQLLPRGDSQRLPRLCPPRCDSDGNPFESYMPAVKKVNDAIQNEAPKLSKQYGNRLSVVNCGSDFLSSALVVDDALMPDRLHPNADGHRILAKCILDCMKGSC
mmetsp:Transcript_3618/g.4103  ORF Transcript_3618/g.4103 Transcript_3618/m.4103 type:complete len:361 (+) Transcript_3618:1-1083(+)